MARDVAVMAEPRNGANEVHAQTELWMNAFGDLGFAVRRIDTDVMARADPDEVARAIAGCELVLAANVCSVPVHPRVRALADTLAAYASNGGRVIFHHHDLPWDPGWAQLPDPGLPPRVPRSMHVGVSLRARRDLQAHGYSPVLTIHDHFDFDAPEGDREATRAAQGFGADEIVLYQPTAATRNTNVAGAVRLMRALHAAIPSRRLRYWLRGPVDDDVARTATRLLEHCPVPITTGGEVARRDAFAACDVVLLPSTWDPSGAAAIESIIARRPCVAGPFPILGELQAIGVRLLPLDEPVELVKFLARPDVRLYDVNLRRARLSFAAEDLPQKVSEVLTAIGISV